MDQELKQRLGEMESRLVLSTQQQFELMESRLVANTKQTESQLVELITNVESRLVLSTQQQFELMESRLVANTKQTESQLVELVTDMKESLEREMQLLGDRFDATSARLDRQGALIQTGSRWMAMLTEWSEKIDLVIAVRDQQIEQLNKRVQKLEDERKAS